MLAEGAPELVADAVGAVPALAVDAPGVPDGVDAETDADGAAPGTPSSPSHRLKKMIPATPAAVQSTSIAAKATSFCVAEGPRGRTTTVAVFPRRGLSGRSGIRIVICPARAGANEWGGVCGYATAGDTFGCGPELG